MVNSLFANALYGLECALDDTDMFRPFCAIIVPDILPPRQAVFRQWHWSQGNRKWSPMSELIHESFCREPQGRMEVGRPSTADASLRSDQGLTIWTPVTRDSGRPLTNAPRRDTSVRRAISQRR